MLTTEIRRTGCFSRWWTVRLIGTHDALSNQAYTRAYADFKHLGVETPQGLVFKHKDARAIQKRAGRYLAGTSRAIRQRTN